MRDRLVVAERHADEARRDRHERAGRLRWGDGLAFALIVGLALLLNYQVVLHPDTLPGTGPGSDIWTSHWNNVAFLRATVRNLHTIPLWNSHLMSGIPFAGDPLAALFYPPMELAPLLAERTFFAVLLIGHLVLAGVGAYALARRGARLELGASLFAAVAFMWTPRLIGHLGAGHVTMVLTASWLPWVALGLILAIRENAIWAAPTGLAFGLAILAGHPQVAFYHVLMICAIALGGIVWAVAREGDAWSRLLAGLRVVGITVAVGAIGALIGAPMILPALEFTNLSLRDTGLTVQDRLALTAFLHDLIRVPIQHQDPQELTFAPSLIVLCLAPFAFWRRRWLAAGLLLAVLATVVLALGATTPVLPFLAAHVPGFGYFRGPARIWFVGALALAIMAALGFDALFEAGQARWLWLPRLALIGLLAANLWIMDTPLLHVTQIENGYRPTRLDVAVANLADGERVYGVERNIRQAVTTEMGINLADGQDPLQIANYAAFMQIAGGYHFDGYALAIPPYQVYDTGWPTHQVAQPNARLLGLLNVGYVLSRHKLTDPNLTQVKKVDNTFIYRNKAMLPQAFVVSTALGQQLAAADMQQLATLGTHGTVVPNPAVGQVGIPSLRPGGLQVEVNDKQPGYLILTKPWYPGWEARIDGRTASLVKIGGILQGVAIPAGTHTIEVTYRPISVRVGLLLCLLGLLLAGALTWWCAWRAYLARRDAEAAP